MTHKTVFKGTINGRDFDNVNDYNAEMTRLVNEGQTNISASSATEIVRVCEDNSNICNLQTVNMLPGFNPESPGGLYEQFISGDKNADREKFEKVKEYHKNNLPLILSNIKAMDEQSKSVYAEEVLHILDGLFEDQKKTEVAIQAIHEELEGLEDYSIVLEEYTKLYNTILNEINNKAIAEDIDVNYDVTEEELSNAVKKLMSILGVK